MQKLILIDGNSIFHRAFYAVPPLQTEAGDPINAVYGFTSMLLNILNKEQPDAIAVAFDVKGKTFRHEEYEEYKGTRSKAPDELYSQFPIAKEVLKVLKIPIYELQGFEADDLLGTLAHQAEKHGDILTYVVTGDKDAFQLASQHTKIMMPVKGFSQSELFGPEEIMEKYGIRPDQVPDQKGLEGDSSDNIKGVRGIGKKTALKLLQQFDTIEGIYENLDQLKGAVKQRLEEDRESAFFSKKLATIVLDAPKTLDMENCAIHEYDPQEIEKMFLDLNFNSLVAKFQTFDRHYSKKRAEKKNPQQTLF